MNNKASESVQRTDTASWDTEAWHTKRNNKLLDWFSGNKDAVICMVLISDIVELWDDLIDKDKVISDTTINRVFMATLLDLPRNLFWQKYSPAMTPIITMCINAWLDATEAEKSDELWKRRLAFYLRNMAIELVLYIAHITGGWEHMRAISLEVRTFFAHEDFEDWEHSNEDKSKPT